MKTLCHCSSHCRRPALANWRFIKKKATGETARDSLHFWLPGLLEDVAYTGAARPPCRSVLVVHSPGGNEAIVRGVVPDGDLDRLHLRELQRSQRKKDGKKKGIPPLG